MSKLFPLLLLIAALIAGCRLMGDFTPPPTLATSQAEQALVQPTATPPQSRSTPAITSDPLEGEIELDQDALEDTMTRVNIRGRIVNGSEGGTLPEDIEVTLYGFDGQQEAFSETTTANEDGEFRFTELEMQPDRVFIASMEYQEVVYISEIAHSVGEDELDLPITIFESTLDLSNLQVDRIHVIIDLQSETILQITELWILSNLGDRTIVSDAGEGVLHVILPDEALNLRFESGMLDTRFQVTTGGFIDYSPIYPGMGSHEMVFSFSLPFDKFLDFSQPISYPVEAVVLLSPEGILTLSGDRIEDLGVRQMTGMTLHNYSMGSISPEGWLEFMVIRGAGTGRASDDSRSFIETAIGAAIFMVALGGTAFWLYRYRRGIDVKSGGFRWSGEPTIELEALDDREKILQALADLDDAHEGHEIEDAHYQELRKSLKRRLMEIMRQPEND